ncbi:MAG: hypothetical protein EOP88_21805 [Verrucomicrobiaceae bacterium]|nr:MAG: hypothetical protein EOP88_21805 [Verrucomicrobiaceae bacterium]
MLKWLPVMMCVQMAGWQLLAVDAAAEVTVSGVVVVGTEPFDGKVTVRYQLAGDYDMVDVTLSASSNGGDTFKVPVETLSGDFGEGDAATFAPGKTLTMKWNVGADWPGKDSGTMKVRVRAESLVDGVAEDRSSDTSTAFRVDTRETPVLKLKRSSAVTNDDRRLITYESAVTGVGAGDSTVFFQAPLPDSDPAGFGVFYGYELVKFSNPKVKLYQAIARDGLNPRLDDLEWKPVSFRSLIRVPLKGEVRKNRTLYFKIVRQKATKAFRVRLKGKFACFYDRTGEGVEAVDSSKNIVLVFHGRGSGEVFSRPLNAAVRRTGTTKQVLTVDWSSGAASSGIELTGGRYLRNLGGAVRERLAAEGFKKKDITTVGHSWGALLSHEVATSWDEGVSRMYVLDPAPAADSYDEKRVNFGVEAKCGRTYGVKGGNRNDGIFGSPNMTRTCDFAVNVLAKDPPSDPVDRWHFYHNLPVDWFIRAIEGGQTGTYDPDKPLPYWDYLRNALLLDEVAIPEKIGKPSAAANEFDLVARGITSYNSNANDADFQKHRSFEIKLKDKGWRYVTLEKNANGKIVWKFAK